MARSAVELSALTDLLHNGIATLEDNGHDPDAVYTCFSIVSDVVDALRGEGGQREETALFESATVLSGVAKIISDGGRGRGRGALEAGILRMCRAVMEAEADELRAEYDRRYGVAEGEAGVGGTGRQEPDGPSPLAMDAGDIDALKTESRRGLDGSLRRFFSAAAGRSRISIPPTVPPINGAFRVSRKRAGGTSLIRSSLLAAELNRAGR